VRGEEGQGDFDRVRRVGIFLAANRENFPGKTSHL
jgi:hypothetical protein